MLSGWENLDAELSRWALIGRQADFWLRDDDATIQAPALERLLSLVNDARIPLALAVIPASATIGLARYLEPSGAVSVIQHGYAHVNHENNGGKKSEFPETRSLDTVIGDLVKGRSVIADLFGGQSLPVLAPPWNRISSSAVQSLFNCGISGLSRFQPRFSSFAATGVKQINTHVDLISWRDGKVGKAGQKVAAEIASHLAARRTGEADLSEATGILSHHLAMDETAWKALSEVLTFLSSDNRVHWKNAESLFAEQ
jgi:hypothetical protein